MGKKSAKKKTTWRAFSLDGEGRKRPSQHQHHAATGNGGSPATEGAGAAASSGGKSEVSSWRRKVIADSISGSETNGGTTASSSTSTTTPQGGSSHHHHQQQQHYYNGYDYHQPYAGRRPWRSPGPGAPYRGGGGRRASGGPRGYHNQSSHFHTASPYHQRLRYDAGRINSLEGDVPDAFTEGYVVTSADQLPSFLQAAASVDGEIPANDESYWTEEQQAAAGYFNPYNVYPCFTSPNSPPVLLSPPYHQLMWYEDPRLPPDCQYYFCLTQPFPPPPSYSPPDGGGGGGGSAGEEDGTGTGTSAEGSTVPTTPESEQQEVEVDSGETSSAAAVESAPDSLSPSATPSGVGGQQQVVPPSPPYIYPGNFMFRPYIYPTTSGHGPFWNWTDNEGPRRFVRRHRRRPFIGGEGITFDRWPSRKNGTQTDDKCNRQNSSLSSSTSDLVSIPATTTTAAMNGDSSPQQQNNQGQENAVSDAGGAANGLERHDVSERTIAATAEQATTIDAPPTDDAGSSPSTEADTVIRRNVTDSSSAPLALDDNVSAVDRSPKIQQQQQQQQPQPLPPPPPLQQRNLVHQTSRDNLTDDRQKVTTTKPEAKTPRSGEPKPQSSPKSSNGRKKTPPQQQQQQQQQPQPPTTEGVDKTKSAPSRNVDRKTPPRGDSRSPKEKRQGGRGKQNKSANQTNGPAATSNGAESQQQEEEVMVVTSTDSDVIRSGGGVVVKMASTSVPSEEEAAAITAIAKPSDVKQEAVEEVEPVSEKISGLVELPVDDPAVGVDDELPAKSVTETVKEVAEKEVPRVHRKVVEAKVTPQPEVAVKSAVDSKFVLNEDADVFVPSSQPAKSEPTRGSPPDKLSSESGADCNGVANGHCNPVTTPVVAANGPTTIAANANAAYRLESPVQYSKYYQLCSQYSMDDLDDVGRLARDETPANAPLGVAGTRRSSSNSNGSVKSHHVLPPGGNEIVLHEATDSASECGSEDVEMIGHRYETAADRIYKNNTVSLAAELLQSSGGQLPYGSPASECRTNSHVLEGFYGSRPAPAGAAAAGPPSGSKSNGHCAGQPTEDGAMVAPRSGDWRRRREAGDSGIHTDESADDDDGGHKMALAAALDEDEPSPYVPPRFAAYGFMVLWWTSFALISFSHEPH